MKKYILLLAFIGYNSYAQTGIGTRTPDASSALDVKLPNKGVLLSRVALTGTTDIVTIPSAANSLTVYNTVTTNDVTPGYYYWNTANKKWIRLLDSGNQGWGLTGNTATIPGTNFIGTTDNKDLIFKRSNIEAGRLGASNTSFGISSLMNTKTPGINNTAIGSKALELNTGTYNTAVGFGTLQKNTNGAGNTAFGAEALKDLADGRYNIGIGMSSLARLTKGIHNVALGTGTLGQITTGNYNIAIGSGAGYTFMDGDNSDGFNTIIGSYDNHLIQGFSGGKNNTILGSRIKYLPNTSFSNNIIIADGEGNRRINVNELGNVGLGTNSPHETAALDISSANKGVLLSRVALTGTIDAVTIPSAANSLTVYNTATTSDVTPGYYYWSTANKKWIRLLDANSPSTSWNLKGNEVTEGNFIGTTNEKDLIFKINNIESGRLSYNTGNTSFGVGTLLNQKLPATWNTAIGYKALEKNLGASNTAIGYWALQSNTYGSSNTVIGPYALGNNTSGAYNVAMGNGSFAANTTGNYNIGIGWRAGSNLDITDGSDGYNITIGSKTAEGLVTGKNNTILGSRVKDLPASLSNNIIIADGEGNRRINVNELGNVGLGTNSPHQAAALEINSTNKGVLLPRVALTSATATAPLSAVVAGMIVYNTATAGIAPNNVTPGQYYHNGSQWVRVMDSFSGWSLTGNTGTVPGTNFIGTTDNNDLIFKRYNAQAGRLGATNTSFGQSSLINPPINEWAGNYNTAIGNKALEKNTSGNFNTATGFGALQNHLTNNYNSAFGYLAMEKNINGDYNTAVGSQALQKNTEGKGNSAFGYLAMENNTVGGYNTAMGNEALKNFSEGTYNVATGMHSMKDLIKGNNNVAVGTGALQYNTTGNYNIAIGSSSGGRFNSTDNSDGFNIIIGSYDNLVNQGFTDGKNNTIIGSRIKYLPSSINNNIIIADGSGNRRINVDDKGNLGLGTNTPHESAALDITSTNKGLLLPRVDLTATNVAAPLSTVTAGMTVYNTATAGVAPNNVTPGVYYHTGSEWVRSSVDNLGNHTANQVLNLANNNITNAKKTDTELLTIKKGTDGSLPTNGKLAMAANAQGDIVWVDPDKLPISIPAPSAVFKIDPKQILLGGSIGSTSVMTAKLLTSSIKNKVSFDESTSKIKLKPGKYKIELVLSLLAPDSPSGTNVHSYFVDFPGQGGRIHQNQVAMGGTISNHGINISSIAIISNDTNWTIILGRGQAGNYVGKMVIDGNDTSNGNYIMITQLPD